MSGEKDRGSASAGWDLGEPGGHLFLIGPGWPLPSQGLRLILTREIVAVPDWRLSAWCLEAAWSLPSTSVVSGRCEAVLLCMLISSGEGGYLETFCI